MPKSHMCMYVCVEETSQGAPENGACSKECNQAWPIFTVESEVKVLVAQFPTFCDLMDISPPGSSACGILQARILE